MNKTQLRKHHQVTIGGALSCTSKMPCLSFNLSALDCKVGSKLVGVKNSVCAGCYALKGNYARYKLITKLQPKTKLVHNENWVNSMVWLIKNQGNTKDKNFFRWFDSGDIQGLKHLKKIVEIAEKLPNVKFWCPTKEYSTVKKYNKIYGKFPSNLIVRVSAPMINQKLKNTSNLTSSVSTDNRQDSFNCISSKQNNECLDCRKCWDSSVKNINYKLH